MATWAQGAIAKASEQVGRVIAFEKEKHGKSEDYWDDWSTQSHEWLDAAVNVNGIFSMCQTTWRELQWADPAQSIQFGTTLFEVSNEMR